MSTPSDKPFEPYEQQSADPAAQGYAPTSGEPLSGTVLMRPDQQRLWATLGHLSPLAVWVLGLATAGILYTGALGPLVLFLLTKDRGSFIRHQAAEALNFQIVLTIAYLVGVVLVAVTFGIGAFVVVPVGVVVGIVALVFQVIAAVKANQGIEYRYPVSWRLVK